MWRETRSNLVGVARYFAWRTDANSRFAGTRPAFVRSLLVYLPACPLYLATSYWDTDPVTRQDMGGLGWAIYAAEFVAVNAIWLGMAFLAAWLTGRRHQYYRYGTAWNWLNLITAATFFTIFLIDDVTGLLAREDAVGLIAGIVGSLIVAALVYWTWAVFHQALKLRWWQSLPLIAVFLAVSIFVSVFASVAVQIETGPPVRGGSVGIGTPGDAPSRLS